MHKRTHIFVLAFAVAGLLACTIDRGTVPPRPQQSHPVESTPTSVPALHVFSKSTGKEISSDLELVASDDPVLPDLTSAIHRTKLGSPIELLEFNADRQRWWVRGARLAWTRVDVAQGGPEGQRVELEPAGVLLVALANNELVEKPTLRLARSGAESSPRELGNAIDPFALEGLAPGEYDVIVEGTIAGVRTRMATRRVQVVAQEVSELTLDLSTPQPSTNEMPLCGTLRIPREWGPPVAFTIELSKLEGSFQTVRPPTTSGLEPNLWSWQAGQRAAGRYMAFVKPFQMSFVFDYEPRTASNFALVIPPPAQVRVKFVDKLTGKPIRDEFLGWYGMPPPQPSGIVPEQLRFNPDRDGFCFTAPVGDIVLSLSDAVEPIRFDVVHIAAGSNEIELKCAPFVRVRVFAVKEGKRVPWPEDAMPRATGAGAEHCRRTYYHGDDTELGFDIAGSYEIGIQYFALDGTDPYEPVSVHVDAASERVVEVEIPLKLRP